MKDSYTHIVHTYIYLAADEWCSSGIMERIAQNELIKWTDEECPLVVTVFEHGGWFLIYTKIDNEVKVIGSANEEGRYYGMARQFRDAVAKAKEKRRVEVRRDQLRCRYESIAVGSLFDHEGWIYSKQEDGALRQDGQHRRFQSNVPVILVDGLSVGE